MHHGSSRPRGRAQAALPSFSDGLLCCHRHCNGDLKQVLNPSLLLPYPQVSGLKSITAKHLALSCQCLGAFMALHPALVALFTQVRCTVVLGCIGARRLSMAVS